MNAVMIALPDTSSAERSRLLSVDALRRRALERLYERRDAVHELIDALEAYQRSREVRLAQCISFSEIRKCSSSFVQ